MIRSLFLAASRNAWLERQFRTRSFARKAVKRFLAGESLDEALAASRDEQNRGAGVLLTLLGENVRGRDDARGVAEHYRTVLRRIREERLAAPGRPGAEISVKLTHLGLDLGEEVAREGLQAILEMPGAGDGTVWVDMEGSSYVDPTLGLYLELLRDHPNLGLCLQAYLRRTPADLERVLQAGGTVRLVKGAYREPAEVAYPGKGDVDRAYLELGRVLRARPPANGGRHVLGTHDARMIRELLPDGAPSPRSGNSPLAVHMLYGVARKTQEELLSHGVPFAVLISYGEQWFPWYMRRLAERPANIWFVVRSMAGR